MHSTKRLSRKGIIAAYKWTNYNSNKFCIFIQERFFFNFILDIPGSAMPIKGLCETIKKIGFAFEIKV